MQASGRRAARTLGRAGNALRERDHGGGDHPVPSRTRQLSPPSPRVLRGKPAGGQDVALAQGVCCVVGPAGPFFAFRGHSPSRAAGAPRAVTLSGDGSAPPHLRTRATRPFAPSGLSRFPGGVCTPEGRGVPFSAAGLLLSALFFIRPIHECPHLHHFSHSFSTQRRKTFL